jgi:hypothetical protein
LGKENSDIDHKIEVEEAKEKTGGRLVGATTYVNKWGPGVEGPQVCEAGNRN